MKKSILIFFLNILIWVAFFDCKKEEQQQTIEQKKSS